MKIIKRILIVVVALFVLLLLVGIFYGGSSNETEKPISADTEISSEINEKDSDAANEVKEDSNTDEEIQKSSKKADADITEDDTEEGYEIIEEDFTIEAHGNVYNLADKYYCSVAEQGYEAYYYFDPDVDETKDEVIETYRGIKIGDTKDKVIDEYGKCEEIDVSEDDTLHDIEDLHVRGLLEESCKTYLIYSSGVGDIYFYLDDNKDVSCVWYVVDDYYGRVVPVTDEEIKALFGTYEKEDSDYVLTVADNGDVLKVEIKEGRKVLYKSSSTTIINDKVGGMNNYYTGLKLYAWNDENEDEKLELEITEDGKIVILVPETEFCGVYLKK